MNRVLLLLSVLSIVSSIAVKHTIEAEGIRASFVEYGASITNLWVPDRNGTMTDVILGFEDAGTYSNNIWKPRYGPVVGRYANRIRNGTFTINKKTYHVPRNENGKDSLHGGTIGYDARNFILIKKTTTSVEFRLTDPDGFMGFPGTVKVSIKYTVRDGELHIEMRGNPDRDTPIMLSSHTYWNLDAFKNPATALITNHTLHLPRSTRRIGVDDILVPTGEIITNSDVVNNFTVPKQIGRDLYSAVDNCGKGCTGYDTAYIVDAGEGPVASLWSNYSGIRVDVRSNQPAFQVFTCTNMKDQIPLKSTQIDKYLGRKTVPKYGCVAMEVEGWIDAINHPEWPTESQIYNKTREYLLSASYHFQKI